MDPFGPTSRDCLSKIRNNLPIYSEIKSLEAGGVEPPSEKRYGPKTTCLSHSIWFASGAWNAQDALPASPINLAGKPRTEVRRPAYCVTPRSQPVGEAGGNGLR